MPINQVVVQLINTAKISLVLSLVFVLSFLLLEPTITQSAFVDKEFYIRQQVTGEISFLATTTNVTMSGPLGGVSGGTATGTATFVVRANQGYIVELAFENNPAMRGEATGNTGIRDYREAGSEPDFTPIASTSATFRYTVAAEPSADLDESFKDNGSSCGGGATGYTANRCWKGPSTSNYQIINRGTPAPDGATSTITFVVNIPANPVPAVQTDFYTATATLTATLQ